MIQFHKSAWADRRADKRKKKITRPYFIGLFSLPLGVEQVQVIYWHLKVKDREYSVSLTKNYYITTSKQNISSIHKLIPKIK